MHKESYEIMKEFLDKENHNKELDIIEIGSCRITGQNYRDLTENGNWKYTGLDLVPGDNVTLLVDDPYNYPIEDNSFDIIISGQTLEHVAYIWLWIKELHRITKKGGRVYIIAPSRGHRHNRPDYWRIQPDGMRALLEYGGFKNIKVDIDKRSIWEDCWGTAKK